MLAPALVLPQRDPLPSPRASASVLMLCWPLLRGPPCTWQGAAPSAGGAAPGAAGAPPLETPAFPSYLDPDAEFQGVNGIRFKMVIFPPPQPARPPPTGSQVCSRLSCRHVRA